MPPPPPEVKLPAEVSQPFLSLSLFFLSLFLFLPLSLPPPIYLSIYLTITPFLSFPRNFLYLTSDMIFFFERNIYLNIFLLNITVQALLVQMTGLTRRLPTFILYLKALRKKIRLYIYIYLLLYIKVYYF